MKKIWQCDFCNGTNTDKETMKKHEEKCVYDKSKKNCYTCNNIIDDFHFEICVVSQDVLKHKEKGNCLKWCERSN